VTGGQEERGDGRSNNINAQQSNDLIAVGSEEDSGFLVDCLTNIVVFLLFNHVTKPILKQNIEKHQQMTRQKSTPCARPTPNNQTT
jgi:adenosyl cobinamide kinase/adenosyl cobinamide phosphate guanylyltransferase